MIYNPINISNIPPVRPVGLLNLSRQKHFYSHVESPYYLYINDDNSNLYNICYMNASIQCFFHLDKFVQNILLGKGKNLLNASKELLMYMINYQNNQKKILSVKEIKDNIGQIDERFKSNHTEDVNEFISIYLDGLLEETMTGKYDNLINVPFKDPSLEKSYIHFLNRFYGKKGKSFILDLFYGELLTKRFCPSCKYLFSNQFSAFNILELPIYDLAKKNPHSSLNLHDILKKFISPNKNDDSICNICNKDNINSTTEIFKLPRYLIIYFGRTVGSEYLPNDIKFEKDLNMNEFIFNKDILNLYDNSYNLKSVIYYYSVGKKIGHYTALCICGNQEYYFDDSDVIKNPQSNILGNPIVLFYEKI